jgi:hypothetical protein
MKEISFKNFIHTFTLNLDGIPEGFRVDLVKSKDSYEVWLYNINCTLSNNIDKRKMLITTIPGTVNGKSLSLKEIASRAERRLINSKYHYDEIEEYTEVFMDQKTFDKFFGIIKTA